MMVSSQSARNKLVRWIFLGASGLGLWIAVCPSQAVAQDTTPTPTADQVTFFETKVRPVLANNCYVCHGPDSQSGKLRLDSRESIFKGGTSGPAVVVGDVDGSLLIKSVRQTGALKMPAGGRLKPEEVKVLEEWVKMGAPWPKDHVKSAEKKRLWSLQPVRMPEVPKVQHAKLVRNPIDAFILAKLEANKQTLSPEADRRTLIRRATYDLTGLPPTESETAAFLADKSPDAYEKVVDRLLASPHYGERMARMWMDIARYADTKGYVFEEDRNYYNAYTYRDWIINAFNRDLPYDQFIVRQLAADRLPEVRDGDDKHALAALGFLTIGRRFLNSQPDIIDDRIDVTMRGLQGFTVECARCHDHKFDPIPTQDYYSLYAVFASSNDQELPISDKPIRDPWLQFNQKYTTIETQSKGLLEVQITKLKNEVLGPNSTSPQSVKDALQKIKPNELPDADGLKTLRSLIQPAIMAKFDQLSAQLAELKKTEPARPEFAMAMVDRPNPIDGYVFIRGNPGNHGDPAPRRFLKALSVSGEERPLWKDGSGRLDLANAIASKDNPLTARVMVNRIWQRLFGAGIVRTPSDFGNQGDKPTHPELLDYLAMTFMNEGWSMKKLQKLIVTSATYRQSSEVSKDLFEFDPENRYLSRMNRRRLDLEEMRDSFLMASGQLDLGSVGGKSVDLWSQPFTHRRALYGFIERQNLPGIFRTFDYASPDSTSARRFQTTVPQQALFFMNSPFSVEQARAVRNRADIVGAKDNLQRIRRLYLALFDRLPSASEESEAVSFLGTGEASQAPTGPWSYGFGSYDASKNQTGPFSPFKVFDDKGYHIGANFPDPNYGYAILNAFGGHPGRDTDHAVIRRWTAPRTMTVQIKGTLTHRQAQGDGVRARIVSRSSGLVGEWTSHNQTISTDVGSLKVQRGETIDFIVDPIVTDNFDSFEWTPTLLASDNGENWASRTNFGPPPPDPLDRLTLYTQALMMTNEFMFID